MQAPPIMTVFLSKPSIRLVELDVADVVLLAFVELLVDAVEVCELVDTVPFLAAFLAATMFVTRPVACDAVFRP